MDNFSDKERLLVFDVEEGVPSFSINRERRDFLFSVAFCINAVFVFGFTIFVFLKTHVIIGLFSTKNTLFLLLIPSSLAILVFFVTIRSILKYPQGFVSSSYLIAFFFFIISSFLLFIPWKTWNNIFLFGLCSLPVVMWYRQRKDISVSGSVLLSSTNIMTQYSDSFPFMVMIFFFTILLTLLGSTVTGYIESTKIGFMWHIYFAFSYFWINNTMVYICDYVFSGLCISHVYFAGSSDMPASPVWYFCNQAFSSSFGTCAAAGFWAPFLWIERFAHGIKCFLGSWTELGIVYSSSLGLSIGEGSAKYFALAQQIHIEKLISSSAIYTSIFVMQFSISIIASVISLIITDAFKITRQFTTITAIYTFFIVFFSLRVLMNSIAGIADGIYVAFGGAPSKTRSRMPDTFAVLSHRYNQLVGEK